jgi:hypothetical protein
VQDRVTNIENRLVSFGGLAFAGLGGWSGPREPTEERREVEDLLARRPDTPQPLVLVSHNVPHGSSLDGVDNPELPAFAQGRLVGSQRCRHAVEALAPVLCLCGHLHEKYGRVERIGGTLCVNGAGAYRGEGVLIDVEPDGRVGEPIMVRSRTGAERVLA